MRTGALKEVKQQVSTSSGDDIITQYTLDDNGQQTTITDPRGNAWGKTYDAMLRNTVLTSPNPGGGSFTNTKLLDGNGNITKTTDFRGEEYWHSYDALNRIDGHGATSCANDVTFTNGCCGPTDLPPDLAAFVMWE